MRRRSNIARYLWIGALVASLACIAGFRYALYKPASGWIPSNVGEVYMYFLAGSFCALVTLVAFVVDVTSRASSPDYQK